MTERDYVVVQEGAKQTPAGQWREVTLRDVCDFRAGTVFKLQYQGNPTGDYPFIKVSDMNLPANGVYIHESANWVSEATATTIKAKPIPKDSIVFAKIGEALKQNRLRRIVRPTIVDNNMMAALPKREIVDPRFLFYEMHQFDFGEIASGTALPYLTMSTLSDLTFPLPPLPEQRSIAHILGALDDKIELNRRMNETLEEMARALFKSWFVDFNPVRAKMDGRGTGLPKHLADLFPDRLVESALGAIPAGWEVKALRECNHLTMGQSPPGHTYNKHGEGLPFFQGRSDFGFRYPSNRRFCTAPTRVAKPGDTLVSVRAPVGDINMAWDQCCIGRGVAALRHKSGRISFTYYSTWTIQAALREYEHTGTVFGAINKRQFEALPVIEPNCSIVNAFDSCVRPLDVRIKSNIRDSRTLAALRDTLLAPMVSGEVRVGKSLGKLHDIA